MAHVKPQTPLHSDGDYIYPLTTADQILLADGNRVSERNFIFAAQEDIEIEIEQEEKPQLTTLWTNPNPASSFAAQTVTLSQSKKDFKIVRICFYTNCGSSFATDAYLCSVDLPEGTMSNPLFGVDPNYNSAHAYRYVQIRSDTTIYFGGAYYNNGTANDTMCVPCKIVGVN